MSRASERVIVLGCKGLLGTPTTAQFRERPDTEVLAVDLPEVDITIPDRVHECFSAFRPTLVINCAAYTRVDDCETDEQTAMRVNAEGPSIIAHEAAECRARLVHISTDYVFDGNALAPYTEDHPTAPAATLSAYGRTKLAGERAVCSHHPSPLIVRTAWLYGPDGPGFPQTILRLAREHPRLRVVNDQTGSPTYAPDLAYALRRLVDVDATGLVHVTNTGSCTWHEFACELLRLAGVDVPVDPVSTAEFPRPARRPSYSVLHHGRYVTLTGEPLRTWKDAAAEFVLRIGQEAK